MNRYSKKNMLAGCSLICLLACALSYSAEAVEKPAVFSDNNDTAVYISGASYNGEYIKTRLYYHNPNSAAWLRMSESDNYLDVVTCQDALVSLGKNGKWQGHLKQDGSCGSKEEPSYFALGNRINYDISLDQDVSSN